MGVGVDETRRDDAPGRVDGPRGLRASQFADGRDTVAPDGDIGAHPRRTRAIDHRAAREEDVVHLFRRHRRLPLSPAFAGRTMTAATARDNRLWSPRKRLVRCLQEQDQAPETFARWITR